MADKYDKAKRIDAAAVSEEDSVVGEKLIDAGAFYAFLADNSKLVQEQNRIARTQNRLTALLVGVVFLQVMVAALQVWIIWTGGSGITADELSAILHEIAQEIIQAIQALAD